MDRKRFDALLKMAVEDGVSDIIFAVGEQPMFRYSGSLMRPETALFRFRQL